MRNLGYQPGLGLGRYSQGITKPIAPKAYNDGRGRWGTSQLRQPLLRFGYFEFGATQKEVEECADEDDCLQDPL